MADFAAGPRTSRADGATPLLATLEWASAHLGLLHGLITSREGAGTPLYAACANGLAPFTVDLMADFAAGPRAARADGATPLLASLEWASAAQCPTHGPDDDTSPLAVAAVAVDLTADSEIKATPRQDGLGGGLGGKPPPNPRLPPLPGWPSAWTLVGSEYYLRHLRTSA